MIGKTITAVVLAGALVAGGAERARADFGDAVAGIIIGGAIVGAIHNQQQQQRPRGSVPSQAWQQTRDMQEALNYFFFNVGVPDGVAGRQTRNGVSQFQAYLNFPATGDITEFERQVLTTSYQRAQLQTPQVAQIASTHPDGVRGVLLAVRDEMLGVNQPVVQPPVQQAPAVIPPAQTAPAPVK